MILSRELEWNTEKNFKYKLNATNNILCRQFYVGMLQLQMDHPLNFKNIVFTITLVMKCRVILMLIFHTMFVCQIFKIDYIQILTNSGKYMRQFLTKKEKCLSIHIPNPFKLHK